MDGYDAIYPFNFDVLLEGDEDPALRPYSPSSLTESVNKPTVIFEASFVEGIPKLWCLGRDVIYIKSSEGDSRPIPICFVVKGYPEEDLQQSHVRARILFDDSKNHVIESAKRCPSHINTGPSGYHLLTVVESEDVKPSYHDEPFSVTFSISALETRIGFQFKCYSSCAKGINRKPIRLVFDLESCTNNSVIATAEMKIKIVGNPERDVRKGETSQPPSGKIKKRKIESSSDDDENVYTIPSFQVKGKRNYKTLKRVICKFTDKV